MATRLSGAPLRSPLDLAATSSSLAYPVHALGLGSRGFTPPERLRPLLRMPAGAGDKEADDAKKEGTGIRLGRLKKTGADKNKNFGLTDADLEQLRAAIQVGGEGGGGARRAGAPPACARTPSERRRRIAAAAGIPLGWCDA